MIDISTLPDEGYEFGHLGRVRDSNGIPENSKRYEYAFCYQCGNDFEYESELSLYGWSTKRFCSTECTKAQVAVLRSRTNPDQLAIREYLERNPVRNW